MKITKLDIQNFLTIGSASVELDDRGLLLIQGKNNDDPSAESNGAGKSSVVDAICWVLYGATARDVSGDAVVNEVAKKDCHVFVMIEDAGVTYKIERFRKDSTHKNQLFAWQIVDAHTPSIDLSKGTDKETQGVVEQIVGCSLDVFMAAVYAGQERMPDLPGMTDKMLKMLIEEAAGVEVLTKAYAVARADFNEVKTTHGSVSMQRTSASDQFARLVADLASYENESKMFEDNRRARAKAKLAEILPVNEDIAKTNARLAAYDETAISDELAKCAARLAAHKLEQSEMDGLIEANGVASRTATELKIKVQSAMNLIKHEEQDLADIANKVGKPCGECGKTYHAEDLAMARDALQKSIDKAKLELAPIVTEWKKATKIAEDAFDAAAKFRESMTDVSAVAKRQAELNSDMNVVASIKRDIDAMNEKVERIKRDANYMLTEANPWINAIASKQKEIERADVEVKRLNELIGELEEKYALLADAVNVFGPAGVRAHILDTVTPYLNDKTRDYLGAIADGNIHATWSTLAKTAKGELKEKFNIDVVNDKGAKSFAGLSGGEKRKVRLATSMALQDMVASRATKPIELYIADEVDHALDESGLERLMGILEIKARERGTVLVISHNALSDWIDEVITVTKDGGKATLTGAVASGY